MADEHVTFVVFTYNHRRFIDTCLESVFAQTYDNMDVFVWDNCSTDGTAERIDEFANRFRGQRNIEVYHSPTNQYPGFGPMNTTLSRVRGDFIVFLAGDDFCVPERVQRLVEARRRTGAAALSSSYVEIDEAGTEKEYVSSLARKDRTPFTTVDQFIRHGGSSACVGSGIAFDRRIYDEFGPLRDGPRNVDVMIPFRGALLSGTYYLDEPLVYRRIHEDNVALSVHKKRDMSREEEILLREKQLSNRTANWAKILEDFDLFRKRYPDDPRDLDGLRTDLLDRVAKVTRRWVDHRHMMMMEGIGLV